MEKKRKHKIGRPTVFTEEVLQKLIYAYSIGCNDIESALYADVSSSALHTYIRNNPDFKLRRDELKRNPILKAKQTVYNAVADGDKITAKWLLEHKASEEYNTRSEVAVETSGTLSIDDRSEALAAYLKQFE